MRAATYRFHEVDGWSQPPDSWLPRRPQLILSFWSSAIDPTRALAQLVEHFPDSVVAGCSSAGAIHNSTVTDADVVATAISFDNAQVRATSAPVSNTDASFAAGAQLARELSRDGSGPDFVLLLSDGLVVNGSDLVSGIRSRLGRTPISGGLAGDGFDFDTTYVNLGMNLCSGAVVAVGFWGANLSVSYGSGGGWEPFGPARLITRSDASTLYELDGQPALDLYRNYLGDEADQLPASALKFPLAITDPHHTQTLVRTILAVDDETSSMRFAGAMPSGWTAQLMRTTFDRLVAGAHDAATQTVLPSPRAGAGEVVSLAVSCVGRRLVLGQRTAEELEVCRDVFGDDVALTGFYSYGEIVPVEGFVGLHNQTMTLTTIAEPKVR